MSALATLGLRYIVFTFEDTAASTDDEPDVVAVVPQRSVHDATRNPVLPTKLQTKQKKIRPPAPIQYFGVEDNQTIFFFGLMG